MGTNARRRSRSSNGLPSPEMNITPLVDVVLVLLIIFMVVTPAINEGESVQLPEILNVEKKKGEPLEVTLAANGAILVAKQQVPDAQLEASLKQLFAQDPERPILLNADAKIPYSDVRKTFRLMQEIGFKGLSLKVLQKKKEGA